MNTKNNYKAWIYLAPSLILLIVFALYPLLDTFYISFLKDYNYKSGESNGFTLENYQALFGIIPAPSDVPHIQGPINAFFEYALPNTLLITFVTVPISIILALIIAVLINSIKVCQRFFQTLFFTPYVTNIIAVGMVFGVIFSHTGLFNSIFGLDAYWVENNGNTSHSISLIPKITNAIAKIIFTISQIQSSIFLAFSIYPISSPFLQHLFLLQVILGILHN